ncbi:MAG: hypothetical protein ACK5SP_02210 [bacterium]|jgi:hypothetical protein
MKKLLVCLLMFCSTTHAEAWLETRNEIGGRIVLLQNKCNDKYPSLRLMMATHPNGRVVYGCWTYFAGMVQVVYDDGTTYNYPPQTFEYKEDK